MNQTQLLIGSLSNDLFRSASLAHRGSPKAATRFLIEAQRWSSELQGHTIPAYIAKLVDDVTRRQPDDISIHSAERYLMYAVLLQNYSLHLVRNAA